MPSLKALHSHRASSPSQLFLPDGRSAVWARSNTDDVSLSQLHKFWSGLSSSARRELLRIDKQALFEQVRKNLYCSRCHGLLVEGYAQIVSYGKTLQAGLLGHGNGSDACNKRLPEASTNEANLSFQDDTKDPSVHPWGGLAATRDSMLTVLDCFLDGTPLEVFESARARERERELSYPDACGGGGRGWIGQSSGSFGGNGRGHGLKETCALHTARLSCEALVDFWTALGEETRSSLLRMKEDDFIERLMFRFDNKRFCRDCRRNVLREYKEMKELKRTRKEPRCTKWFCAADTVFRYEVSDSMVQVNWRDCFAEDGGSVHQRFEWSLGTAEGKADIFGFEDVGLSENVLVEGLDLSNIIACYITVRGWKRDGRCTELSAKAHPLNGQLCVHRRLMVGDGYVSITKGESIHRFFEHAEETEEEEDDDTMDKDGNEIDSEGSRPQKHAKSPELARDFLLDAATVIFKEQVEKAFREGTARQNAHSIFVCLALSLLEERVRVACKEITTLEKQNKLLEEEEYEKREEEERRERRKLKEKEKKLRRKEKLRGKEREKEKSKSLANSLRKVVNGSVPEVSVENGDPERGSIDQISRFDNDVVSARPSSPDMAEVRSSGDGLVADTGTGHFLSSSASGHGIEDALSMRDGNGAFIVERTKNTKRRSQSRQALVSERSRSGPSRRDFIDSCSNARNPAGIAPSPRVEQFSLLDRSTRVQEHGKSNSYNYGMDGSSNRADNWYSRHRVEDFQHCGCGGPQTSLQIKGSHQDISRLESKNSFVRNTGESVNSEKKGLSSNDSNDNKNPQDNPGVSKGKLFAAPFLKRTGEGELEKIDADVVGGGNQSQSRRSIGAGDAPTGSKEAGEFELASCDSSGTVARSPDRRQACSESTRIPHDSISLGGQISQSLSSGVSTFSRAHGVSGGQTGKAKQGRLDGPGKSQVLTTSPEAALIDCRPIEHIVNDCPGLQTPHGEQNPSDSGGFGCTIISSRPILPKSEIEGASADTYPPVRKVIPMSTDLVSSSPSERVVVVNGPAKLVATSRETSVESEAEVGKSAPSVVFAKGFGRQDEESTLPLTSSTGSSCPVRPEMQNLGQITNQKTYSAVDTAWSHGSIRSIQMPRIIPPPLQVRPHSGFGYIPARGPCGTTRFRDWIRPLSQTGGFLIPGSNNLALSMTGLSAISLPQGAQGVRTGHLPGLSTGVNALQGRDSVFLPRFVGGPDDRVDGRTSSSESHVLCVTSSMDTFPVIQTKDSSTLPLERAPIASTSAPVAHKDDIGDSSPLSDSVGFSLFHFSDPAAVAQSEADSSTVVPSRIESTRLEKSVERSADMKKLGTLNDTVISTKDASINAGEYSLFAKAGKELVFF